jgi:23S rRNA (guanosine2251-2'-O)-methyltransferase
MVERSRRGKRKHRQSAKLLGSHARSWIWGRHLVRETLIAGRWPIVELHLADSLPESQVDEARQLAQQLHIPVQIVDRDTLARLGQTSEHQGYLARMGPFPYAPAEDLINACTLPALFLVLDAIQDPFNFGAMLRSAAAFGLGGVFIGTERQAPVSSQVARSSAGVINHIPVAQVESLVDLARRLKERGIALIGASEKGSRPLTECDLRQPVAIVIGNEGAGIHEALAAQCCELACIPMESSVGSLNAAAAAAVFCFEAYRQRTLMRPSH